jgi:tRNA(Ile)-lysidine synthase TilS/MesJ
MSRICLTIRSAARANDSFCARRDISNDDEVFTRNWVRKRVIPLLASKNPKIRENLAALAEDVRGMLGG